MSKFINYMIGLLAVYGLFFSGYNMGRTHYADAGYWAILTIVWTVLLIMFRRADRKLEMSKKELSKVTDEIDETLKDIHTKLVKQHALETMIGNCCSRILGKEKPNKTAIPAIEQDFLLRTGKYVKLSIAKNGKYDYEVSEKPFTNIPIKDKSRPSKIKVGVKKDTKRTADQAKRDAKNARRRAAYAAKKK